MDQIAELPPALGTQGLDLGLCSNMKTAYLYESVTAVVGASWTAPGADVPQQGIEVEARQSEWVLGHCSTY
ncbi:hypothetical protein GN956_G20145 [Arapaima gigas]